MLMCSASGGIAGAAQDGLDSKQSLLSQYGSYLSHLLHGDLGTSTSKSVSVTSVGST